VPVMDSIVTLRYPIRTADIACRVTVEL
jgi:hypothetical protein